MQSISAIGLDIAKSVFQVHGIDAAGLVVIRHQLRRRHVLAFFQKLPPCLVGIEACASSHHWSRELQTLGQTVRLMPPAYVKPYVKRQKNDTTDAEPICEAVLNHPYSWNECDSWNECGWRSIQGTKRQGTAVPTPPLRLFCLAASDIANTCMTIRRKFRQRSTATVLRMLATISNESVDAKTGRLPWPRAVSK